MSAWNLTTRGKRRLGRWMARVGAVVAALGLIGVFVTPLFSARLDFPTSIAWMHSLAISNGQVTAQSVEFVNPTVKPWVPRVHGGWVSDAYTVQMWRPELVWTSRTKAARLPLWSIGLAGMGVCVVAVVLVSKTKGDGRCVKCGYVVEGIAGGRCPECGLELATR
jgi:hypothetical protein